MRYLGFEPSEKGRYYFVSYNSKDIGRVSPFVKELNSRGVSLWYDYGIPYDENWSKVIAEKICKCDAVLLFYTNGIGAKENSYVIREYDIARLYVKTIYVIKLDRIDAKNAAYSNVDWLLQVQKRQLINGTSKKVDDVVTELLRYINPKPVISEEIEETIDSPRIETSKTKIVIENANIEKETDFEIHSSGISVDCQPADTEDSTTEAISKTLKTLFADPLDDESIDTYTVSGNERMFRIDPEKIRTVVDSYISDLQQLEGCTVEEVEQTNITCEAVHIKCNYVGKSISSIITIKSKGLDVIIKVDRNIAKGIAKAGAAAYFLPLGALIAAGGAAFLNYTDEKKIINTFFDVFQSCVNCNKKS